MSKPPPRLGRGLSSLISPEILANQPEKNGHGAPHAPPAAVPSTSAVPKQELRTEPDTSASSTIRTISIDRIRANPNQPRKQFDEAGIEALARSISHHGTLQPIVVRPADGGFELIAGERRLRAAQLAGLAAVPAIIRHVADHDLLELALVENVQRADLNPIEKARAYRALHDRHGLSHEEIASRMGEDRASISNTIRLLELSEEAATLLVAGELGAGHGKALLGIIDRRIQSEVARRAAREGWSVRRLESVVRLHREGGRETEPAPPPRPAVCQLQERLSESLGVKVTIREGRRKHTGRIQIDYHGLDDIERIMIRLGVPPEQPE